MVDADLKKMFEAASKMAVGAARRLGRQGREGDLVLDVPEKVKGEQTSPGRGERRQAAASTCRVPTEPVSTCRCRGRLRRSQGRRRIAALMDSSDDELGAGNRRAT